MSRAGVAADGVPTEEIGVLYVGGVDEILAVLDGLACADVHDAGIASALGVVSKPGGAHTSGTATSLPMSEVSFLAKRIGMASAAGAPRDIATNSCDTGARGAPLIGQPAVTPIRANKRRARHR